MSEAEDAERGKWPADADEAPGDWEWRSFSAAFEDVTSQRKLPTAAYQEAGQFPVVDQGQGETGGYTDRSELVHPTTRPVLIFGDHTRCVKLVSPPFVQGADGVKVLRPRDGLDVGFAYHSLTALRLPDKGYSRHFKFLRATAFPVPPLNEQRRIVAKLDALRTRSRRAKDALDAVPALLDRLRQSILAAAFRGDLTADWREQNPDVEPASELLKRIRVERRKRWEEAELATLTAKGKRPRDDDWKSKYVEPEPVDESELPELPERWCWARAQDLADSDPSAICAGPFGTIFKAKDFRADGVPIIFLRHVAPGRYLTHKPGFMDRAKWKELFQPYSLVGGELLITKLGEPPGACAIYPEGLGPAMVTPDVIKMAPDRRVALPIYLMRYFNSDLARGITFGVSYGMTRSRMTLELFRDMPVPVAPADEQRAIVGIVEESFGRVTAAGQRSDTCLRQLAALDAAILAAAFRGELLDRQSAASPGVSERS